MIAQNRDQPYIPLAWWEIGVATKGTRNVLSFREQRRAQEVGSLTIAMLIDGVFASHGLAPSRREDGFGRAIDEALSAAAVSGIRLEGILAPEDPEKARQIIEGLQAGVNVLDTDLGLARMVGVGPEVLSPAMRWEVKAARGQLYLPQGIVPPVEPWWPPEVDVRPLLRQS